MLRVTSASLFAAAAIAVAGCGGGGGGDKEKIESTVRDYYTAFADGDGAKACDQLAKPVRDRLVTAVHARDCPAAIEEAGKRLDISPYTKRFRDAKVISVKVHGRTATAQVRALGQTQPIPLGKEKGAWKIEGATGAGGG